MSGPPPPQQQPSDEEIRKQRAEAEAIKQKALAMLLDSEARQRLTNIKMVKPDLASAVENYLINAATTGRLNRALTDNELKQIPLLEDGARLQQGATYVDLIADRTREFTATGDMEAGQGHAYAPKDRVPYEIWNRLIGEEKPGQGGRRI